MKTKNVLPVWVGTQKPFNTKEGNKGFLRVIKFQINLRRVNSTERQAVCAL